MVARLLTFHQHDLRARREPREHLAAVQRQGLEPCAAESGFATRTLPDALLRTVRMIGPDMKRHDGVGAVANFKDSLRRHCNAELCGQVDRSAGHATDVA